MTTTTASTAQPRSLLERVEDAFDWVWRLLCSVKLAILVISLLAVAVLIGTLLPQPQADILESPLAYGAWLAKLGDKYGEVTVGGTTIRGREVLAALGLFNVFSAPWFRALLAFVTLQIIVCTLNRFPPLWKSTRRPRIRVARAFFNSGETRAQLTSPLAPAAALETYRALLARKGFRLMLEREGEQGYVYADRFGLSPLATFINNLGLVLILLGAVWGSVLGFREDGFAVADGRTRAVGHGTGLVVLNEGFTEENWPDTGRPKDYRSDLVLYEDGVEVARQTVRVNEPLTYKGISFHQAFFGNAADIRVRDTSTGQVLFDDSVPMPYVSELYGSERPMGTFSILDGRVQVDVIGTSGMMDTNIAPGQVGIVLYISRMGGQPIGTRLNQNEPAPLGPLEFTFTRERQYAGLQVVSNPGVAIIWLACALMVTGILIVFWLPPRKLWAQVLPAPGGSLLLLRGMAPARAEFPGEFERLIDELRERLGSPPPAAPASDGGSGLPAARPAAAVGMD